MHLVITIAHFSFNFGLIACNIKKAVTILSQLLFNVISFRENI